MARAGASLRRRTPSRRLSRAVPARAFRKEREDRRHEAEASGPPPRASSPPDAGGSGGRVKASRDEEIPDQTCDHGRLQNHHAADPLDQADVLVVHVGPQGDDLAFEIAPQRRHLVVDLGIETEKLRGDLKYGWLITVDSWKELIALRNGLKSAGRDFFAFTDPVQHYLTATGRTLFKDLTVWPQVLKDMCAKRHIHVLE